MLLERVLGNTTALYFIECDGGYFTEYASKEKDSLGRHKEFGARLVEKPNEHAMVTFSGDMAFSDYGENKLKAISDQGFNNPRFVKFTRATCLVLFEG